MKFHIQSPSEWKVISNQPQLGENESTKFSTGSDFEKLIKTHCEKDFAENNLYRVFDRTITLSSYLYCVVAGPYACIEYKNEYGEFKYPLRIFFSKSLAKYVEAQKKSIFAYYVKSINFYEKFYQVDHPFVKQDHIFCPEFTVGAMEFPGVITYTDRLVFRELNPSP